MQVDSVEDIYYLITLLSSTVIIILGLLLHEISLPAVVTHNKLRGARTCLSLSYLILGGIGMLSLGCTDHGADIYLLPITAFTAAFQALLFTSTLLVFIQPLYVNRRWIVRQVSLILGAGLLLLLGCIFRTSFPLPLLYVLTVLAYLVQQVHYVRLFSRKYADCLAQMEHYYDEEQQARLRWIKISFYSALSIGLLSICSSLCGMYVFIVFTVLYTVYYTYFVVRFYNYRYWAGIVVPAVTATASSSDTDTVLSLHHSAGREVGNPDEDRIFAQRLKEWVDRKGYVQKDLSVDEIAELLGTNRNYLRYYFRTYIQTDFRTWRSELRIREAKRILKAHPDYSLNTVAEMTGFNHRANFFNQFQKITGISPAYYRDREEGTDS